MNFVICDVTHCQQQRTVQSMCCTCMHSFASTVPKVSNFFGNLNEKEKLMSHCHGKCKWHVQLLSG